MNAKPKANSIITTTIEASGDQPIIVFTVRDVGELRLDLAMISEEVRARAMLHGLCQRIADAAALSRSTETGKPASAQDKHDAMKRLVDHYNSGTAEWNIARAAGGGGGSDGYLLQALFQLYPDRGEAQVREFYSKLDKKQRAALIASPKIAPIIDALRAKGAGVSEDEVEAMLGELE